MLADLAARLTPAGLPEWAGLLVLGVLLLLALCIALMPFSVFGVKARLDAIESQLDELRAEIRGLSVRLAEGRAPRDWGGSDIDLGEAGAEERSLARTQPSPPPRGRSEPRITWPRG